jgi:tetratricopeptide (TPR) repeat protein
MRKAWLRRHYRGLPLGAQRVLTNERLERNMQVLHGACASFPKVYALHSSLADSLEKQGRHAEAFRVWFRNTKAFHQAPNPYFQRSHWLLKRGDFQGAQKLLRMCLDRDKGYFRETALFWRAEALFRVGRLDEAEKELSRVNADYEEHYFLNYRSRSKSDLLADIQSMRGVQ